MYAAHTVPGNVWLHGATVEDTEASLDDLKEGFGEEVAVRRAQRLGPGSYPFLCTIHPFMRGAFEVVELGQQ